MASIHSYPSLHRADRLRTTIDQNVEQLNYLKQQVEVTSLKIKNLKVIQADQSLNGEDERQATQVILKLAQNNDALSLENILSDLL